MFWLRFSAFKNDLSIIEANEDNRLLICSALPSNCSADPDKPSWRLCSAKLISSLAFNMALVAWPKSAVWRLKLPLIFSSLLTVALPTFASLSLTLLSTVVPISNDDATRLTCSMLSSSPAFRVLFLCSMLSLNLAKRSSAVAAKELNRSSAACTMLEKSKLLSFKPSNIFGNLASKSSPVSAIKSRSFFRSLIILANIFSLFL